MLFKLCANPIIHFLNISYRRFIDFFTLKVIVRVDVSSDHMNKSSHNNNARVGASHLTSYIYCMGNK